MTLQLRNRISAGSCLYCRKRRFRCDTNRPCCNRCRRDGQQCSYEMVGQLRWVGGMAIRGKLALNNSPPDPQCVPRSPSSSPYTQTSDLLLYFDRAVLPRFQMQDKVELDLSVVLQDESLQQAILAVSQAHYILSSKCRSEEQIAIQHHARQCALRSFRGLLDHGISSNASAQQLFTVNVLLCMLDGIIEPSSPSNASVCHLRGGFAILDHWNGATPQMLLQNGLTSHLLSVFATMDLVHALISGDKPYFEPTLWLMFADVQAWWGRLSINDSFLALLKSFAEMACLGNTICACLPSREPLSLIGRCLPTFEDILAVRTSTFPTNKISLDGVQLRWEVFCSIYKCCGTIYIQRALKLKSVNDEVVQSAVSRAVELLDNNVLPGMMSHCLIFPILVVGAHSTRATDQQKIMRALGQTASYLSFGSLPLMADFLRETWAPNKSTPNWWDCFAIISERAFFF